MPPVHLLSLTTGDPDGIGTEVVAKALAKISRPAGVRFILWRSPLCPKKHLAMIDSKWKRTTVNSFSDSVLKSWLNSHSTVLDVCSDLPPARWVELSAQQCLLKKFSALVTGPLSKTSIRASGLSDLGHTEILMRIAGVSSAYMAFVGSKFSVVLATAHIPLAHVSSELSFSQLMGAVRAASFLKKSLSKKNLRQPLALLGLNPHAGESGLIGREEGSIHKRVIEQASKEHISIHGPLVPDAAFLPQQLSRYSVFVANYHDQGLIPFKALHGQDEGVHLTLGLPFIRTSVDHGTAKDLFLKNRANPGSMIDAIKHAIHLTKSRHNTTFT